MENHLLEIGKSTINQELSIAMAAMPRQFTRGWFIFYELMIIYAPMCLNFEALTRKQTTLFFTHANIN